MKVLGYDPQITVQRAWQLSSGVEQALSLDDLFARCDAVTVHVPLNDATRGLVNDARLRLMRPGGVVLNFARAAIVDEAAILAALDRGHLATYVCDFPTRASKDHARVVALPHLGASTGEAEENCAVMVADTLRDFLENGNVRNSVNFPEAVLPRVGDNRVAISNDNVPNMVGQISTCLADAGLNIADLLNKSRGDIAYTLIDTDAPIPADVLAKLRAIPGVLAAPDAVTMARSGKRAAVPRRKAGKAGPAGAPTPALKPGLESIRERIDAVDAELHALINERARLAQQVGISKHAAGHTVDFYRPEREAQVLRQALERNREERGPLRDEEILRLFREIMSACLAQQEPLKVGFLGPEGTFTQQAVYKQFGHSVRALPLSSIEEVFHEVESGTADFGVVPIENSSEGTVNSTLDMFLISPLGICGEVELRIHHNLMGQMSALDRVRRICAHPQALAQCRGWLAEHMTGVERVPVASNAEGARRARDEGRHCGDRADGRGGGVRTQRARAGDRGPARQHHALSRHRAQVVSAQRPGQDDAPRFGRRHRRTGRAVPPARAVRRARHQHDAHRVAPVAASQVGLRLLHRPRGPRGRRVAGEGTRTAQGPGIALPRPRLLSAGDPLTAARTVSDFIVEPGAGVAGRVRVPGDKSISHRALMLGAIASGTTRVTGFLEGEDCLATLRAVTSLGATVERPAPGEVWIEGVGLSGFAAPTAVLDMGNAGTAMRLFMGLLAGQPFDSELVGDQSLMQRPMERVAQPLRDMGASIETLGGRPPVRIHGAPRLHGIQLRDADGERPGEVGAAAGRAVCGGRDDRDRARGHA
jgi:chorismate mutase-like protein